MASILVVEDSADQARLIAALLESAGYTVSIASDGAKALASMANGPPDLVVTDLIMPGMNGLEVVEAVTRGFPLVPVILMTAFGSGEIGVRALQKGAASYVPKARLREELVPTVESTLALSHAKREQKRLMAYLVSSTARFELDNEPGLILALVGYVQDRLHERVPHCDENQVMQVGIAIQEAVLNAMHHGNLEIGSELREADPDRYRLLIETRRTAEAYRKRRVCFDVRITPDELRCSVRDEGPGFDPATVPDPTDPANLERVSGRGLYLIHTFMDDVQHNKSGNEITLLKRFVAPDPDGEDHDAPR